MKLRVKDNTGIKGKARIIKSNSLTGEVISISDWFDNLVVAGTGTGVNIITRLLGGDNTYSLQITSLKIGTGTTPPTNSDTDIETEVFEKTSIADKTISTSSVLFSFFIGTGDLPNGTYTELTLHAGTQLFSRLLITPAFVKGTNEDLTIEYQLSVNN